MSILDDAIREHLELKRAHGADEAEIKRLEDEAFGPPGRPGDSDALGEAPTEFLTAPEGDAAEVEGGRRINIADLQEPPPSPQEGPRVEVADEVGPEAEAAPIAPAEDPAQAAPPAEEEPPAEAELEAGPSTEERHAIADQPTQFFDVEAEMGTEDAPATAAPSPSDEEIAETEAAEPPLAPVEPATEIYAARSEPPADEAGEEEEDDDFWSEQRLSDELDQALEAPLEEDDDQPAPAPSGSSEHDDSEQQANYDPDTGHEDVLEDTPDFLEDAPEDDELWFEQRPPKDFDFDD